MSTSARSATGPLKHLVDLPGLKRPHAVVSVKSTKQDERA